MYYSICPIYWFCHFYLVENIRIIFCGMRTDKILFDFGWLGCNLNDLMWKTKNVVAYIPFQSEIQICGVWRKKMLNVYMQLQYSPLLNINNWIKRHGYSLGDFPYSVIKCKFNSFKPIIWQTEVFHFLLKFCWFLNYPIMLELIRW